MRACGLPLRFPDDQGRAEHSVVFCEGLVSLLPVSYAVVHFVTELEEWLTYSGWKSFVRFMFDKYFLLFILLTLSFDQKS